MADTNAFNHTNNIAVVCGVLGCNGTANLETGLCKTHGWLPSLKPGVYLPGTFIPQRNEPIASDEVRITDDKTGGQKGSKLARFDLIPPEAIWALAEVYGKGCEKYADRNWEKGYKWGLSVAALQRHLNLWLRGESIDKETGRHHLMQVAWHAFTLFTYEVRGLGTDDVRAGTSAKTVEGPQAESSKTS